MDALVLIDEATFPGVHVPCPGGRAYTLQVGDVLETKRTVVPEHDHHGDHLQDLSDLSEAFLDELDAFPTAYRILESKQVTVKDRRDRAAAMAVLAAT